MVFSSDRNGNSEIFAMVYSPVPDGGSLRQVTNNPRYDSWWPRISPDRTRILFYRTPAGSAPQNYAATSLWLVHADGSNPRLLRAAGADGWDLQGHAEWSPDGRRLVMFGGDMDNSQIFVTDDEGQRPQQVTSRPGMNIDPSWSPDGSNIVFVGCPNSSCVPENWEIYTVTLLGGSVTRLTYNNVRDHDPYFSPDQKHIAWLAETKPDALGAGVGFWDIFVMKGDGSDQRNLTQGNQLNSLPLWSHDGLAIYFPRYETGTHGRWTVYRISLDGSGLGPVTDASLRNCGYPSL
jgi:Tol biopolymer transport system component